MLSPRSACVLALISLAWFAQGATTGRGAAQPLRHVARAAYSADQIVVRAQSGVTLARLRVDLAARELSLGRRIPHTRLFAVRTNGRTPTAAVSLAKGAAVTA